ncbi:MAG TPA: gluconate 2-dehydrogenase subunit 3 family protein [Myxococcaceae bacterium]|nr:gluconate 2-dehydrogenase subunit 3 family protein [Myxococcaceae bacterium]
MENDSRRKFLKKAGLFTLVTGAASVASVTQIARGKSEKADQSKALTFFSPLDAAFIASAVSRLIPADELGPGALEADVPVYIDRQLSGAHGGGDRFYRSGPWQDGSPSQGYQLRFTPAELFRTALPALHAHVRAQHRTDFSKLSAEKQDDYLKALQKGGIDLAGVPSQLFFARLWALTVEGFFADPAYGGNKDMVSWRMIGFPGAYGAYYELVDQHGLALKREPQSLADGHRHGHHMEDPNNAVDAKHAHAREPAGSKEG